jgi:hypothetical protein
MINVFDLSLQPPTYYHYQLPHLSWKLEWTMNPVCFSMHTSTDAQVLDESIAASQRIRVCLTRTHSV